MFILYLAVGPMIVAGAGATALTLALRDSSQRRAKVKTTPDGVGTSQWNNNCTFGPSRSTVSESMTYYPRKLIDFVLSA